MSSGNMLGKKALLLSDILNKKMGSLKLLSKLSLYINKMNFGDGT
jgi:hypothetical protein